MKIYLVYAKIPDYLKGWAEDTIEDFNFNYHSQDDSCNYVGLYAWTIREKEFNEFKETRSSDFFVYKESKITKDELKSFRKVMPDREMLRHSFAIVVGGKAKEYKDKKTKHGITMVLVSDEFNKLTLAHDGYIAETYYEMTTRALEDYYLFNEDIKLALDVIGYTTDYDITFAGDDYLFDDEERSYRNECASYNLSYQLSSYNGNPYINLMANEFNSFTILYAPLIFGKKSTITKKYKRGELY